MQLGTSLLFHLRTRDSSDGKKTEKKGEEKTRQKQEKSKSRTKTGTEKAAGKTNKKGDQHQSSNDIVTEKKWAKIISPNSTKDCYN